MTVQWIAQQSKATPGPPVQWLGASGMLGLSDAELLRECADMDMGDFGAQDALQACKAHVNAVRGEARGNAKSADNTVAQARALVTEIEALVDAAHTAATNGQCSAAQTNASDAKKKHTEMLPMAPKLHNIFAKVSSLVSESYGDGEVNGIKFQVGAAASEVEGLIDGMGNAVANARTAANKCTGGPVVTPTTCPEGQRLDPATGQCVPIFAVKAKGKGVGWGLALLAAATVGAIAFGMKGL